MKSKLLCATALLFAIHSHGQVLVYEATLSGPAESPPNVSPGIGSATVAYDLGAHTLQVDITFSGLAGTTTASHIHGPTTVAGTGTAGVATMTPTFVGFPLGTTSGTYSHLFDLTSPLSYNPSFVVANGGTAASAEAALTSAMAAGETYLNINSNVFPSGEIRGFLTAAVPEPVSTTLATAGALGGLALWCRKFRAGTR
jgi:hypothetical protein